MRVHILGSTGYIGKALYSYLSKRGVNVSTIGRNNCDHYFDMGSSDFSFLASLKKGDVLILLAAISSPDNCLDDEEYINLVNVKVPIKLVNELHIRGVKLIFSSSDTVFGNSKKCNFENDELKPFGIYGNMKAEVESALSNYENTKIVRFSYVMGPGDRYTTMLEQYNKTVPLEVYRGFERNVVALTDVLEGLYNLIHNWTNYDEKIFNFSGPDLVSRDEMTRMCIEQLSIDISYKVTEAPDSFWLARPKIIEMRSVTFKNLLGRKPMTVIENLKNWREKL